MLILMTIAPCELIYTEYPYRNLILRPFHHLPRSLHQFMCGAQGTLAHFAEHLGEFQQARFAIKLLDTGQSAALIDQFLDLVMLFAKDSQLG